MTNYYCLVAGLPDLSLEDGKLNYTVANFKSEIYSELSEKDRKLIDLFYLKFDNANLLKLLKDKEAATDFEGNYSQNELLALISSVREGDAPDKSLCLQANGLSPSPDCSGRKAFHKQLLVKPVQLSLHSQISS